MKRFQVVGQFIDVRRSCLPAMSENFMRLSGRRIDRLDRLQISIETPSNGRHGIARCNELISGFVQFIVNIVNHEAAPSPTWMPRLEFQEILLLLIAFRQNGKVMLATLMELTNGI